MSDELKNEPLADTPATVITNAAGLPVVRETPTMRAKRLRDEETAKVLADAEAKAAAIVADAEAEAAAEAAQRALEAGGNEMPAKITKKVEKRLSEPAAKKVARIERGIVDFEARDAAIGLELAAMAIEREAGDPDAIIASRALRHERERLREALEDMRAALVPAQRQAAIDHAAELQAIREQAMDRAELPLMRQETMAATLEVKLHEIADLVRGIKRCDSDIAGLIHPYAGVEAQFLFGLPLRTIETVLIARLAQLGVIGPEMAPGGNIAHAPSVYDTVKDHANVIRGLLAQHREAPAKRPFTVQPIQVWEAGRDAIYTAGPLIGS